MTQEMNEDTAAAAVGGVVMAFISAIIDTGFVEFAIMAFVGGILGVAGKKFGEWFIKKATQWFL